MPKQPKPAPLGCPHCGNTGKDHGFEEADILWATAYVNRFNPDGTPEYEGESKINWDSQILDEKDPEPYKCRKCGKTFAKPVPVEKKRKGKK